MTHKQKRWIIGTAVLLPILLILYAFKIEPHWLKTRTISVSTHPKIRIAHLSDLHFRGDDAWLKSVVAKTNELNPDVICITGDFIETAESQERVIEILEALEAPVLAVAGNHEDWSGVDMLPFKTWCNATGGKFLQNESMIMKGVHFFGATATSGARPLDGDRRVLLCHYPAVADNLNGARYELILAGHTHGGQVRLPWIGALIIPYDSGDYEVGTYSVNGCLLHVSPGIGTYGIHARFLCRPEVTILEL